MSPTNTFHPFSRLPAELRDSIFNFSMPSTTTIHISEAEFEVTQISSPPSLLTTSHEAREAALKWELKKYPIWTVDDWQDIYLSPSSDTILELVIEPSKSHTLNITWTELHEILHDALTEAKRLHIVCSEPERLARLFMLPEGEIVSVGESCVEKGLFGSEVISSDRNVRQSLQGEVLVTTSTRTVEEIRQGEKDDVRVWSMVDEEVSDGFGPEARVFTTKAFEQLLVDGWKWSSMHELHDIVKASGLLDRGAVEEEEGEAGEQQRELEEKSGDDLTMEALKTFNEEMAKLRPKISYNAAKEA